LSDDSALMSNNCRDARGCEDRMLVFQKRADSKSALPSQVLIVIPYN